MALPQRREDAELNTFLDFASESPEGILRRVKSCPCPGEQVSTATPSAEQSQCGDNDDSQMEIDLNEASPSSSDSESDWEAPHPGNSNHVEADRTSAESESGWEAGQPHQGNSNNVEASLSSLETELDREAIQPNPDDSKHVEASQSSLESQSDLEAGQPQHDNCQLALPACSQGLLQQQVVNTQRYLCWNHSFIPHWTCMWPGYQSGPFQQQQITQPLFDVVEASSAQSAQFEGASQLKGQKADSGDSRVSSVFSDQRTTVMLRNLPNNMKRDGPDSLLEMLNLFFVGLYDFVYLPMDFEAQANYGYAFVNFRSPEVAQQAMEKYEGFSQWNFASRKVCETSWSNPTQGYAQNVERYRNSPVMHESMSDEYKPMFFNPDGERTYPAPTKSIGYPGPKHRSRRHGQAKRK